MCNVTITPSQVSRRVKERKMKWGDQFPVLIRADYRAKHKYVKEVMDACTQEGVWKLSFVAVYDRKSGKQLTK
jgi:biopolymer transport protein ExbD